MLICDFRGLIIQNRSVWPILFLLNVFTALKGTHFYLSAHTKVQGKTMTFETKVYVLMLIFLYDNALLSNHRHGLIIA